MTHDHQIVVHKNQSDMFDFLKEVNNFCEGCAFIKNYRCIAGNSDFFSVDVREEEINFSSCLEHTERIYKIDNDTGVLQ